jgi:hypothetical protein
MFHIAEHLPQKVQFHRQFSRFFTLQANQIGHIAIKNHFSLHSLANWCGLRMNSGVHERNMKIAKCR